MQKLTKRHVVYTEYYGGRHLQLIAEGWREHHCLIADGITVIKLTKEMENEQESKEKEEKRVKAS